MILCWGGRRGVRACRQKEKKWEVRMIKPCLPEDVPCGVTGRKQLFFLNFCKIIYIFGKKTFKTTNKCLPNRIKYGNNENCRNNIQENPHEHIEIWCLQNRKHSYRSLQLEGIAAHVGQVPCLIQGWSRGRAGGGTMIAWVGVKHRGYPLLS